MWEERKGKREDLNVSPLSFSIFVGREKGGTEKNGKKHSNQNDPSKLQISTCLEEVGGGSIRK